MDVKTLPRGVYIGIGIAFFAMILSFEALIFLIIIALLLILGVIATLFRHALSKTPDLKTDVEEKANHFHFSQGVMDFINEKDRYKLMTVYKEKHAMTGSDDLDSVLEQLLNYIIRDFINTWYKNLTTDDLFQESLLRSSRRSIGALSQCVKKVDWVPLLTRNFIDDLASHLRLYRKSMEKIETQKTSKHNKPEDLETIFFDLELEMEKNYCRDLISTSRQYESAYLHDIADILLYLLMPSEDFRSRPLRFLVREILVSKVFIPLFDKLSEPDYITYLIVRLLSEVPINTDDFITTIETSQCVQELEAILESIHDEMNSIKSKDSIGSAADTIKQELASLEFAENLIKRQMVKIANQTEDVMSPHKVEVGEETFDGPIVNLPITVVLTNHVAITSFVEFLNQVGGQNYIDLYLAIDGFKISVSHQLRNLANGESPDSEVYETIKEAALFMYHQYLSQEAVTRVPFDDSIINKFLARLRNDEPQDSWFEQIQDKLVEILGKDERFYPAFKKHPLYIKMLEELGVLTNDDEDEGFPENGSDPLSVEVSDDTNSNFSASSVSPKPIESRPHQSPPPPTPIIGPHTAVVVETLGVGQQGKQMFALYNVRVNKNDGKNTSSWNMIRRYSDFHTLNATVQSKYRKLRNLSFPGKKTFNNLDQHFLERRCKALNEYITCILQPKNLQANPGLEADIYDFLSQKKYTGNVHGFSRKMMNAMFDPILTGVKAFGTAVTQVPESGFVNKVSNEINRALRVSRSAEQEDHSRVAAQLENIDDENIPLRVMLLLVDEVFGLRGRNQWFRRRLVSVLRQFVNAAFGSSINRRIIDVVQWLTSGEQVLQYIVAFRDSMWPNGHLATHTIQRPTSESLRARFLARCLMLSALPDELRLFMGSTTTNIGIIDISNALQNRHLNRRLCYVLFERLLVAIFPNSRFDKILNMLHSKSPRMRYT